MRGHNDDPVLRSSRREAALILAIWLVAMVYTVTYCYVHGYQRSGVELSVEELNFVLGFPDWGFWGIVAPWGVCLVISFWFAFWFIRDEDLGADEDDDELAGAPAEGETIRHE